MTHHNGTPPLAQLEAWGRAGGAQDVDRLMAHLAPDMSLATSRAVDYALGLVATREGRIRLQHYLFNGEPVQRNYAALYFKRHGITDVLDEAVQGGYIDAVQGYAE